MRYVATTAAVFGAAMIWAPGSHASLADARNFHTIINKPAIMADAEVRPQTTLASQAQAPATQPKTVAVSEGDNLTKLADAHGTTYQRLYDANPVVENPDLIFPGQELLVPAAEEALTARPLPANAPAEVLQTALPDAAAAAPQSSAAAPARQQTPVSAPAVASGSVWDQLALCESGGNWAINTGNGFYGGLQFTLATWQGLGGSGLPSQASREEQISRGEMLLARSGWGQWPACTAKMGLR
jgi:LysM repeat protein